MTNEAVLRELVVGLIEALDKETAILETLPVQSARLDEATSKARELIAVSRRILGRVPA